MRLTFHGAAGEVTGSCHLVETDRVRFLVDCGLFQGGREAAAKNLAAFPFDVRTIDFVVITHAHLDHSGLLLRLVALGYRNPVYCTSATADLLEIMLRDSAYIHEKEAAWANERRASTKRASPPIEPLYTIAQAEASFPLLSRAKYGVDVNPHPAVRVRFQDAGHILGAAIIELWLTQGRQQTKFVFSGDLGKKNQLIVKDPHEVYELLRSKSRPNPRR